MTLLRRTGTIRTSLIALFSTTLVVFFAVGCQESTIIEPDVDDASEAATRSAPNNNAQRGGAAKNFVAPLSGAQEVPAVETNATGVAKFKLNKEGTALSYKLNVANIENVLMAHIHFGAAGENGPVVVWLYPEGGPPPQPIEGRSNGTLAEGTITDADVVGPLADFDALIEAMKSGNTYVNVHTEANPSGEVRGQIDRGNGMAR